MDGYELAARMRAEPRVAGVRLIALTGYSQPGDRQRSTDAGFVAHLVKPVSIDMLVETLDVMR
jgi:CheY-like chemotaxis protein